MPALPALPVFSPGVLATTQENQLAAFMAFWGPNIPIAKMRQTSAQTLTTAINTAVTFDVHDWDNAGGHTAGSTKYNFMYPGLYEVSGGVSFANNATSWRFCAWSVSGSLVLDGGVLLPAVTGNTHRMSARTVQVRAVIGDYVELIATQNSGGNLNTATATSEQASMNVRLIGA